ncbi:MAG: minor capsid protein [Clostridia bacterium]|nr:minor capsid protein [Clostridia bacterium]
MNNSDYWIKRAEELKKAEIINESKYVEQLKKEYERAVFEIQKETRNWLARFAVNNQISLNEAKKWLNANELKELKWNVKEYIKHGEENGIDLKWKKELENASSKFHISRLESLQLEIQNEIEKLSSKEQINTENFIIDTYKNTYYKQAYELQKGHNVAFQVASLDTSSIKKVISRPWTADSYTFSDRIWKNKNLLLDTLQKELTQSIIRGKAPDEMIEKISKVMGVNKNKAATLVMTESAFFSSVARKECFKDLGVEQYEIVATLDSHTSDICRELDGKVFKMSEYKEGTTAPPFHVRCRSTTAPYFNDEFEFGERAARNENGKTYYVPSNITYEEWKAKYVDNSEKSDIMTPNYIRMNITNTFNPKNEVEAINSAIMEMPKNVQEDLRNTTIEIFSKGQIIRNGKEINVSFYDRNEDVIYIYQGASKSEVIHEIGHLIETKYKILDNPEYINIRNKGLENYSIYSVKDLKNYSNIKGIKSNKFISEQQGRVYYKDLMGNSYIANNQKINLNCLGEYFSEGFREYFENPTNLKSKDIELFKFIERKLNK